MFYFSRAAGVCGKNVQSKNLSLDGDTDISKIKIGADFDNLKKGKRDQKSINHYFPRGHIQPARF